MSNCVGLDEAKGCAKWIWKARDGLGLSSEELDHLKDIMKSINVLLSREKDEVIWSGSKQGVYSVKIGYKMLESTIDEEEWPCYLCWNKYYLPKVGTFS